MKEKAGKSEKRKLGTATRTMASGTRKNHQAFYTGTELPDTPPNGTSRAIAL
jgi:hypothetical protein